MYAGIMPKADRDHRRWRNTTNTGIACPLAIISPVMQTGILDPIIISSHGPVTSMALRLWMNCERGEPFAHSVHLVRSVGQASVWQRLKNKNIVACSIRTPSILDSIVVRAVVDTKSIAARSGVGRQPVSGFSALRFEAACCHCCLNVSSCPSRKPLFTRGFQTTLKRG